MRIVPWVAAALAAWPVAAACADGWSVLGPGQLGASRGQIEREVPLACAAGEGDPDVLVCQPVAGALRSVAGVPVQRLDLTFRQDRLEKVTARLHESQFDALERFVAGREGAGRDCSYVFRGGMGAAQFVNRILLWSKPGYALVIQQFQGKIDRSALSYGTQPAMADVVRETTAYPAHSRRDL